MTGSEHRARAEQLLGAFTERRRQVADPIRHPFLAFDLAEALVHAVLALAPDEEADQ